jgi:hypothetical protein
MADTDRTSTRVVDILIYVFFIIFLLSIGNSIFVNQVGFFGAFFLILVKIAVTKQNKFHKTGLELAFVLYILAEVLSLIFSEYQSEALRNLTKRAAIIIVFYTTIAATTNSKWGKKYFIIYIGGMLATILVYLFFSAEQFLNDLYGVTQSGPSVFQYPITTSEIIGFTVVFLFAFLVNERTTLRIKIFTLIGFLISVTALVATFKRTGWIGTMFGIVIILIATKRWKTLAVAVVIIAVLLVVEENKSEVIVFDYAAEKIEMLYSFETEGRAYNFTSVDSICVVVDFDNGLSFYEDDRLIKNVKLSAAVNSFTHLKGDFFLASLYDTRFLILKKDGVEFREVNEMLSPGYTKVFRFENNMLYVLDSDSGLTVFTNPYENDEHIRFLELNFAENFLIDSSFIYFQRSSSLQIRELKKFLPTEIIAHELAGSFKVLNVEDGKILINIADRLELLDNEFNKLDSTKVGTSVTHITKDNDNLYLLTGNNDLLKLEYPFSDSINIISKNNLGFTPNSLYVENNKIYTSIVERSRLLSIFDTYVQTNITRFALWRAGWEMFKDNPLFGLGDVDLAKYYLRYKRPIDKEIHGHLHNNYIHFLATLGLFGFLVLVYLFVRMFVIMSKHFKETKGKPFINSYALGAIAGLACTLFAGLTELNFWDQEIATLIYFTVGLSAALFKHHKNEDEKTKEEIK